MADSGGSRRTEADASAISVSPFEGADGAETDPLNAMGKHFLTRTLNVTPAQSRSEVTLSRLLERAEGIARRHGEPGVTLKGLAEAANVSLTSVYRYFSSPEQVIRLIVRRIILRHFDRIRATMDKAVYETPEALAAYLAGVVGGGFLTDETILRFGRNGRVEKYFDIAYAELNDLAGDTVATLRRCGIAPEGDNLQASLAASMAAIGAAARMGFYHHPGYLRDGPFEAFAYRLLLSAMLGEG